MTKPKDDEHENNAFYSLLFLFFYPIMNHPKLKITEKGILSAVIELI